MFLKKKKLFAADKKIDIEKVCLAQRAKNSYIEIAFKVGKEIQPNGLMQIIEFVMDEEWETVGRWGCALLPSYHTFTKQLWLLADEDGKISLRDLELLNEDLVYTQFHMRKNNQLQNPKEKPMIDTKFLVLAKRNGNNFAELATVYSSGNRGGKLVKFISDERVEIVLAECDILPQTDTKWQLVEAIKKGGQIAPWAKIEYCNNRLIECQKALKGNQQKLVKEFEALEF